MEAGDVTLMPIIEPNAETTALPRDSAKAKAVAMTTDNLTPTPVFIQVVSMHSCTIDNHYIAGLHVTS